MWVADVIMQLTLNSLSALAWLDANSEQAIFNLSPLWSVNYTIIRHYTTTYMYICRYTYKCIQKATCFL